MKVVAALETSTRRGSVALLANGRVHEAALEGERAHASDLLPALDGLLRAAGAAPSELDACAVGIGPGSFTGLRVAVATAFGLTRGSDAVLVGIPSFEALALDALAAGEEASVLQDARAGALYLARYARTEDGIEVLRPPCVVTADELAGELPPGQAILGDDAAFRASGLADKERARLRSGGVPTATAVLRLGQLRLASDGPTPPSELEPLYLRPFAVRRRAR
ncbi:MAG: tRNA (adenosine(37)-N6)-threonylcarbamoyltransferase complex dimerization subunit type 1 TsaB [Planctomycetota bacterium]